MKDITYESTHSTPGVVLDSGNGLIEMYGRSIPENAINVYRPIIEWLDEYGVRPKPKTVFNFRVEFFNTSSSKFILQMLKKLEVLYKQGFQVEINWYYNDEDILDLAEDYQELISVPITFHEEVVG